MSRQATRPNKAFGALLRLRKLRRAMKAAGLDGLLVSCPENILYLSGFHESYAAGDRAWSAVLLITAKEKVLISDFRFRLQAAAQAPAYRFVEIARGGPAAGAARKAKERGIGVVGYEAANLSVQELSQVRGASAGVKWKKTQGVVESLRVVKEEAEIREIARAAKLTDAAYERMIRCLAVGKTEREIARAGEIFILEAGAKGVSFEIIVASGANGALPHAVAGERKIRRGDLVVMDLGVQLESGYCADLTRTVAVGKASKWQREIYGCAYEAQAKGLAALCAGAIPKEVDGAARNHIAEAGFGEYFGHALGHGVGLAVHEEPRLSGRSEEPLMAGMVVTIEPGIYLPGRGGVRIEDLCVVTDKGHRVLSRAPKPKELMII